MAIITPEFPNPVPIEGVILNIASELGDGDFLGLPTISHEYIFEYFF